MCACATHPLYTPRNLHIDDVRTYMQHGPAFLHTSNTIYFYIEVCTWMRRSSGHEISFQAHATRCKNAQLNTPQKRLHWHWQRARWGYPTCRKKRKETGSRLYWNLQHTRRGYTALVEKITRKMPHAFVLEFTAREAGLPRWQRESAGKCHFALVFAAGKAGLTCF